MRTPVTAFRAVSHELARLGPGAVVRAQTIYDLVTRRLGRTPDFHAVMSALGYLAEPVGSGYFRIVTEPTRQAS